MIEIGLRTWLLAQPSILTTLPFNGPAPVFIDDAIPKAREYILISVTDGDYANTIDPNDAAHWDLVDEEVDIDVKCDTAGRAKAAGTAILDALFPKIGDNTTGTMGDRTCEAVYLEDAKSGYEPPQTGETKGRHVMQITLRIHSRRT